MSRLLRDLRRSHPEVYAGGVSRGSREQHGHCLQGLRLEHLSSIYLDIIRARTATTARIARISTPTSSTITGWSRLHLPQVVSGHLRVPELLLESARDDLRLSCSNGLQHSACESWPVQFRSADGGTMRQINRVDAERIIIATMADFRTTRSCQMTFRRTLHRIPSIRRAGLLWRC